MAVHIYPEILRGSELDLAVSTSRKRVRVIITGLQVDSEGDPEVLWRAYQALIAAGYAFNTPLTGHPDLSLQRFLIRGFTTDGCIVDLFYEIPSFGGAAVSAMIVRDRQSMTSSTSNSFVDASGKLRPIEINGGTFLIFQGVDISNSVTLDSSLGTVTALDPMRVIQVSGLTYGLPNNSGRSVFGHVNSDNFQGLGRGFWLVIENETNISKYQSYYTFSFAAASRVIRDWSETVFLRSELTGKIVKPTDADINTLNSGEYVNDLVKVDGGTRVGRYPLAEFGPVFGGVL